VADEGGPAPKDGYVEQAWLGELPVSCTETHNGDCGGASGGRGGLSPAHFPSSVPVNDISVEPTIDIMLCLAHTLLVKNSNKISTLWLARSPRCYL
jgi:hypothetical protein